MPGPVLAILEQKDGKYRKSAFEVATAAQRIAAALGSEANGLVIGAEAPADAGAVGRFGIARVLTALDGSCAHYVPEVYAAAALRAIEVQQPQVVLIAASSTGKDLAPRLAAALKIGLATDCTELEVVDGSLEAVRPVYAGKAYTRVAFESEVQMASLRPNVFLAESNGSDAAAEVTAIDFDPGTAQTVFKEFQVSGGEQVDLGEADIVVSGGRGLKGPENFHLVEELAASLGAAVGASRAVVDAGWRPHAEQVGQTGRTVSPNLYIAVGISGAIQHLAGMSSSKVIVAINKDKEAPIFAKADYGVVGDALEIVPELIAEIKRSGDA